MLERFSLPRLSAGHPGRYHEFLRHPSMSMGLYVLPAGGEDTQRPHREDEVYVVLRGAAGFVVDGVRHEVAEGDVLFVGKSVEHRFVDIGSELQLLVFFAPAESE